MQQYRERFEETAEYIHFGEQAWNIAYLKREYEEEIFDLVFPHGEEGTLADMTVEEQLSRCRFFDGALADPLFSRKFNQKPPNQADLAAAFARGYAIGEPSRGRVWRVLLTRDGVFLGFLIDGNHLLYIGDTIAIAEVDTSGDNNGAGYKGGEDTTYALSLVQDPAVRPLSVDLSMDEDGQVRWPEGITEIPPYAFADHTALRELTLPEGIVKIGRHAFDGCVALTSVTLPRSLRTLGTYAFAACTALREVILPEGVTIVSKNAFRGCTALVTAVLTGVRQIASYAFFGCTSLRFPECERLARLGAFAFCGCTSLTDVDLPQGVESIGFCAFQKCASLRHVRLPAALTEMGEYVFDGCGALKEIRLPACVRTLFYETQDGAFDIHCRRIPSRLKVIIE